MNSLLGPDGTPIKSKTNHKKASPPKMGEAFGIWAGRNFTFASLPGGGLVQFDLEKLTLADFRIMRPHYQINASQAVLSFMQHQSDWHVVCKDKKIADLCEEQLKSKWTELNRAFSTANWAGYGPAVLQWENDLNSRTVVLDKIKDLVPEECRVNWKEVDGWSPPSVSPPKFKVYDGIKQYGQAWPIPVNSSFWYPLLMQEGDYYGRKLLKSAFIPWYFSMLIHLFSNRYFERFGEPTPIGRAPFDDVINTGEALPKRSNEYMIEILAQLRNRSVVVLPNDSTEFGNGRREFDYDIQYLEGQLRGADFERYLTRLDEEMSIAMFTPILLLRTADVGSYNLGIGHTQTYLQMLNAMNEDRKLYIDKYILSRMTDFNFSESAPRPQIVFNKMGNQNSEIVRSILTELIRGNKVNPDLVQLGDMAGLTLTEIKQTLQDPASDQKDSKNTPEIDTRTGRPDKPKDTGKRQNPSKTERVRRDIINRITPQVDSCFASQSFGSHTVLDFGYRTRLRDAFVADGVKNADDATSTLFSRLSAWVSDAASAGIESYKDSDEFTDLLYTVLSNEIDSVLVS